MPQPASPGRRLLSPRLCLRQIDHLSIAMTTNPRQYLRLVGYTLLCWLLAGCTGLPDDIRPVQRFELERYLGTWHEIARLDHGFERGLEQVTADYAMRQDGGVRVLNRGYSASEQRWQEAEGRAYFVESAQVGHLKVSFFGPFYGSYVIFELDPDYSYAFITSYNKQYLWLLARTPTVSDRIKQRFRQQSQALGFAIDELIWPAPAGNN